MTVAQNADGTPHLSYYDLPNLLSFIWDGKSTEIQVSHGGYGEPIFDTIRVASVDLTMEATAEGWMAWFASVCQAYVQINEGNLPS